MIRGTPFIARFFTIFPALVSISPVIVGGMIIHNSGLSLTFVQLYAGLPVGGETPLFSVPVPAGAVAIIDYSHLMGGISSPNLHIATSTLMASYSPGTASANIQLMVL